MFSLVTVNHGESSAITPLSITHGDVKRSNTHKETKLNPTTFQTMVKYKYTSMSKTVK